MFVRAVRPNIDDFPTVHSSGKGTSFLKIPNILDFASVRSGWQGIISWIPTCWDSIKSDTMLSILDASKGICFSR